MSLSVMVKTILQSGDPVVDNSSWQWVFHSDTAAVPGDITTALTDHVDHFLNAVPTGGSSAICSYISSVMNRTASQLTYEYYDITSHLNGSPHGSPIAIVHKTLGAAASQPYAEGVAATISFRSDYGTDVEFGPGTRPRSRDRNRVYIGPLETGAFTADLTTHRVKLATQFMTDCLAAIVALSATVDPGGLNWNLRQWSRRSALLKLPTVAWMDDRPDYQRRRSDPNPGSKTAVALASV